MAIIALGFALGACHPAPARLGDTHVGRGQLYRAGRPAYDTFFEHTHQVQAQAMVSLDEERRARAPVEHALGGDTSPSSAVLAARVVAHEQQRSAGPPSARDAAFADALGRSLDAEASVAKKYDPVATRASELSVRADELLASTERDFSRSREREEVSRELSAAKLVLQAAALRTRKVANDAQAFVNVATEVRKSAPREEPAPTAAPVVRARNRIPNKGKPSRSAADAPHRVAQPPHATPASGEPGPAVPAAAPARAAPQPSDDFNP